MILRSMIEYLNDHAVVLMRQDLIALMTICPENLAECTSSSSSS